ncbi:dihydroxyacetone kinase 1 [Coprinopsis marcescibilis]|uniref:Dihydroxyacetone kinase 1 n=1 Tax=Coprinopsis marcescibilis TaxID=230819 RepID=A0A5C3LAH7_COPMA|nr:dihydroxyacetone kinase 1 [Coprinopsis marcescibilis]
MSTQSKHFLNTPESLVVDSLHGLCAVNPQVALDVDNKILFIKNHDQQKVSLMCGGGSGHEPAHSGYVGEGMLTAAVCGSIFASPNASQVRRGIDLIDSEKGTVIIVKNYTGDILNFGLAKEQYAANHPAKAEKLRFVIVGDDVAVGRSQGSIVGRRGLAGTVLVYKIAGAFAQQGADLNAVDAISQWAAENVVTIGSSLGHTHVPGTAPLQSNLADSELEIGMGIHNESGNKRESPLPSLSALVSKLLDYLTSSSDPDRNFLTFKGGDSVVLMVNNLGGVSVLELGGVVAETQKQLEARGFNIARVLSGTFMTSLNMPGFSLTLLLLPREGESNAFSASQILSLLDAKPRVPGWPWAHDSPPLPFKAQQVEGAKDEDSQVEITQIKAVDSTKFTSGIKRATEALIANEAEITRMDSIAGDGDCGLTLKAGAQAVLSLIKEGRINGDNIISSLIAVSQVAEEAMGGTSGALYSIFFSGLAQGFQFQSIQSGSTATLEQWKTALGLALDKLFRYTRARPPSRTLVDPLAAFINAINLNSPNTFADAVTAAANAAEETKKLDAKAGRSAYVEGDALREQQVADPGAWGVKTILESLGL